MGQHRNLYRFLVKERAVEMVNIALIVGIDDYLASPLSGCVNDAMRLTGLLKQHHNEDPNFECKTLVASPEYITRTSLKQAVEDLFKRPSDIALLFFAGHGTVNNLGGYLVTQDAEQYDE